MLAHVHTSRLRNACARTWPKFGHRGHRASRLRSLDNGQWITPQEAWKDNAPLPVKAVYRASRQRRAHKLQHQFRPSLAQLHCALHEWLPSQAFPTPVHGPHQTKMFLLRHKPLQLACATTLYTSFFASTGGLSGHFDYVIGRLSEAYCILMYALVYYFTN